MPSARDRSAVGSTEATLGPNAVAVVRDRLFRGRCRPARVHPQPRAAGSGTPAWRSAARPSVHPRIPHPGGKSWRSSSGGLARRPSSQLKTRLLRCPRAQPPRTEVGAEVGSPTARQTRRENCLTPSAITSAEPSRHVISAESATVPDDCIRPPAEPNRAIALATSGSRRRVASDERFVTQCDHATRRRPRRRSKGEAPTMPKPTPLSNAVAPGQRSYARDRSQIPPRARRRVSRCVHRGRACRDDEVRGFGGFPERSRPDATTVGLRRSTGDAVLALISRPVRVRERSERCSSALGADPSLRRARSVETRSTSACQRVERRRCSPDPRAAQAPCRCSCLPHGRPSPWRTSQAAWAARLVGDPCPGRAGAARAARAVQPGRERVPTGAQAGVRGADRRRSGLGSCRTRRRGPVRLGGRPQTDASHGPSGRPRTAARRFLSRSDLRSATALST